MLLNVWGIIWSNNKKIIQWPKENAANGTAIPPQSATLARQGFLASGTNAFLSSHYPMFWEVSGQSLYVGLPPRHRVFW